MIVQTFLGGLPGQRIDDYSNSTPRYVKVLGIGDKARGIVASFTDAHRGNVLVTGNLMLKRPVAMDEPVDGLRPNAVVVVYQKGDEVKFPFLTDRTASMLSFIVIEADDDDPDAEARRTLREIQAVADLYVTTSDGDFVAELIDNLAA